LKSLENSPDFFVKTKTLLFVLEAPRDQDFGLEDYITRPRRGGSSKLIDRGSYRVKGAYPMSRAQGDNHVRIS